MIALLINVLIILLILGVIYYIITLFPLPHPWHLVVRAVFALIALLIILDLLFGISGTGGHLMLLR